MFIKAYKDGKATDVRFINLNHAISIRELDYASIIEMSNGETYTVYVTADNYPVLREYLRNGEEEYFE